MCNAIWTAIAVDLFFTPFVIGCFAWRAVARRTGRALVQANKALYAAHEKIREAKQLLAEDAQLVARLHSARERLNETIVEQTRELSEYNRLSNMAYNEWEQLLAWWQNQGGIYRGAEQKMQKLADTFDTLKNIG